MYLRRHVLCEPCLSSECTLRHRRHVLYVYHYMLDLGLLTNLIRILIAFNFTAQIGILIVFNLTVWLIVSSVQNLERYPCMAWVYLQSVIIVPVYLHGDKVAMYLLHPMIGLVCMSTGYIIYTFYHHIYSWRSWGWMWGQIPLYILTLHAKYPVYFIHPLYYN